MSVNGITKMNQTYENKNTAKAKSNSSSQAEHTKSPDSTAAAVYEKSEQTADQKKIYTRDQVTIDRLKAEAEKRTQGLRDLVQKLLKAQGETFTESTDIYGLLREGKVQVDEATRLQAQKDVAEDGYWGVEQTADRMVEFAKAVSGGDTTKANILIDAVKKGFDEATKAWGGELPEISKKTIDSAISKLEAWRDGTDTK
ncbi:MAG: hypothetical protein K0R34_2197 [Herbinix sp.]|jgi:hypothetical protein|nr:hypothetical protein [Herbinix sp.]